jgi:hypothetical protein
VETCSCIEFQTENSRFDETGSLDDDDLYSVHVDVEKADPLCIKLNDLIRGGKIQKDKILYRYLSDVVEIMYNPFHEYDREVVEFFNSFSSGDKFHIFHSIASDINISTSIYPPLKRKPLLKSS